MENTTLGVAVESLRSKIGIHYFLVPLLVGSVLYAALKKIKILGDNDEILITISFAIAFLIALVPAFAEFITEFLPYALTAAVVLFILVMLFMFFGTTEEEIKNALKKPVSYLFIIILVILLVFYVASVKFGPEISPYGNLTNASSEKEVQLKMFREVYANPKFIGTIVFLTILSVSVWLLSREEK